MMKKCHITNFLTSSQNSGHQTCHINLPLSKKKMMSLFINTIMVSVAVITVLMPSTVYGEADSDATASIMDGLLTSQNRAAKPEPFLDRIAALFGGVTKQSNKGM